MPNENAARPQDARELIDHTLIVGRIQKESERGEQIEDSLEAASPRLRQTAHVAATIAQRRAGAARAGSRQKRLREIETIDAETCFGQQMGVTPLATGYVEYA